MNSMITYNRHQEELELLRSVSREVIAELSEDSWELDYFSDLTEMQQFLDKLISMDVACLEIDGREGVASAADFRRRFSEALIMLIADASLSPVHYMTPDIMAASLMLRPVSREEAREKLRRLLEAYLRAESEKEVYTICNKEETHQIPLNQIICFESRQKKIFVRTQRQEIGFWDTLDHITETLPESFMRVHKSFIVNLTRIRKAVFSENVLYMDEGTVLPISRSYRMAVRACIQK